MGEKCYEINVKQCCYSLDCIMYSVSLGVPVPVLDWMRNSGSKVKMGSRSRLTFWCSDLTKENLISILKIIVQNVLVYIGWKANSGNMDITGIYSLATRRNYTPQHCIMYSTLMQDAIQIPSLLSGWSAIAIMSEGPNCTNLGMHITIHHDLQNCGCFCHSSGCRCSKKLDAPCRLYQESLSYIFVWQVCIQEHTSKFCKHDVVLSVKDILILLVCTSMYNTIYWRINLTCDVNSKQHASCTHKVMCIWQ